MDLEKEVQTWVPHLDEEAVVLTAQKLRECGVDTLDHLKYVVEGDLMFLSPITRRILLQKFGSFTSLAPAVPIPPGQNVSATAPATFTVPWNLFPPLTYEGLQGRKAPREA